MDGGAVRVRGSDLCRPPDLELVVPALGWEGEAWTVFGTQTCLSDGQGEPLENHAGAC